MKIYYQLWSVNDIFNSSQERRVILEKLKSLGYCGVELYNLNDEKAIEEVAIICKELNLDIISIHMDYNQLVDNKDFIFSIREMTECSNFVIPFFENIDINIEDVVSDIVKMKDFYATKGINIYYHNHDIELVKNDGVFTLDIIAKNGIQCEYDTFWLAKCGVYPPTKINEGHCAPMIHFKDLVIKNVKGEYNVVDCVIGEGNLDFQEIVKACKNNKVENFIVEQEHNPRLLSERFNEMKNSIENIQKIIEEIK